VPAHQIHLVRHGEVHNPDGVLYGRLPGFGLSDRGHRMAQMAADHLTGLRRPLSGLWCSPLQRTRESAAPIAAGTGLPLQIAEGIIEPSNVFEGKRLRGKDTALRQPSQWRYLANPMRPSWGEPYRRIAARMLMSMNTAADSVESGDVVLVGHQLPIWIAHRQISGLPLFHDPRARRCSLSSVTSFIRVEGRFIEIGYVEPARSVLDEAIDVGAV